MDARGSGTTWTTVPWLLQCLAPDMSKMLYSSLKANIKNLMEQAITCCGTKQTVQVRTTELHRTRQGQAMRYEAHLLQPDLTDQAQLQ